VFLAGERLVALRAVVHALHLLTPAVSLHVIVCIRLEQQCFRSSDAVVFCCTENTLGAFVH
jgi:hypothetical protein